MVLVKTNKEKLLHLLEQRKSPLEELPTVATWIYDGMAVFRSMNVATLPETFAELAECIFSIVTGSLSSPKSISIPTCLLNPERDRRTSISGEIRTKITSSLQKCPRQWSKFLFSRT